MTALVCFTLDNLGDAADLGRGVIQAPRPPGQRPPLEQGFPALLALFEAVDLRITHFVEGWSGAAHGDAVRRLVDGGHSLGMHGWLHEKWAELDAGHARELAERATETLEGAAGVRPRAFRAPGGRRAEGTATLLAELGYRIDASLAPDGSDGGAVAPLVGDLWTVPYAWTGVDASHWLWQQRDHDEVEALWKAALLQAAAENRPFTFIWHPHVMGIDKRRLAVGERVLRFVLEHEALRPASLEEVVAAARSAQATP